MKIKNLPKEIYLVLGDINDVSDDGNLDFEELSEVTWCDYKAFDNDIKYVLDEGWHDLRKNPDDVPSDDRYVLCCIKRYGCTGYSIDCYIANADLGWARLYDVLAWREIPKLEEE